MMILKESCFIAVSLAAIFTVAAADYSTTSPPPKCYKAGEKCMGAPGYPAIPWLGCCDDYVCEGKAADWGFTCTKKVVTTSPPPKCYKAGEKCMGAPGYPAVPWLGCCDDYVCEGKAADWGFTCTKKVVTTSPPPKCYKAGEKCMGAPGYPAVPWLGCCDDYVCEGKAADWGLTCTKKVVTTSPPPKCYKAGEKCAGAEGYPAVPWLGCCDGYSCGGKAADWGYICVPAGQSSTQPTTATTTTTTATKTTSAICIAEGMTCGGNFMKCCGSATCQPKDYGVSTCKSA